VIDDVLAATDWNDFADGLENITLRARLGRRDGFVLTAAFDPVFCRITR
jgi:hypothetical protein